MTAEEIQVYSMIIIVMCFVGLILVILHSRKKEMEDIGYEDSVRLQNAIPKPVLECDVMKIHKSRWKQIFLMYIGYKIGLIVLVAVMGLSDGMLYGKYSLGFDLVGIMFILIWVIVDVVMTKRVDDKVIIPGYIQSTFYNRRYNSKTAQLVYYDFRTNKFRLKTVSLNRFEKQNGEIYCSDRVQIIVSEKWNRVKFVSLYRREYSEHLLSNKKA